MQIIEVKFLKETIVIKYAHDAEKADNAALSREVYIKYIGYAAEVQAIAEALGELVTEAEAHILGDEEDNEEDMRIKG